MLSFGGALLILTVQWQLIETCHDCGLHQVISWSDGTQAIYRVKRIRQHTYTRLDPKATEDWLAGRLDDETLNRDGSPGSRAKCNVATYK